MPQRQISTLDMGLLIKVLSKGLKKYMELDQRKRLILESIVEEYIDSAAPISSGFLAKKYDLDLSPATLRNEMAELTNEGYLVQPHTSAGRIPTEKAYRVFIQNVKKPRLTEKEESEILAIKYAMNEKKALREATKILSYLAGSFGFGGILEEEIVFCEGLTNILRQPEFENINFFPEFARVLDSFYDSGFDGILQDHIDRMPAILIGEECPMDNFRRFGMITARSNVKNHPWYIGIFGPKRMNYPKNIALIEFTQKTLEEIFNT